MPEKRKFNWYLVQVGVGAREDRRQKEKMFAESLGKVDAV